MVCRELPKPILLVLLIFSSSFKGFVSGSVDTSRAVEIAAGARAQGLL
jgi:hypothetical protein